MIQVQEYAVPLFSTCLSQNITSPLTVFLKHSKLDFSKAFDSISYYLTWLQRPKGAKDEVKSPRLLVNDKSLTTTQICVAALQCGLRRAD